MTPRPDDTTPRLRADALRRATDLWTLGGWAAFLLLPLALALRFMLDVSGQWGVVLMCHAAAIAALIAGWTGFNLRECAQSTPTREDAFSPAPYLSGWRRAWGIAAYGLAATAAAAAWFADAPFLLSNPAHAVFAGLAVPLAAVLLAMPALVALRWREARAVERANGLGRGGRTEHWTALPLETRRTAHLEMVNRPWLGVLGLVTIVAVLPGQFDAGQPATLVWVIGGGVLFLVLLQLAVSVQARLRHGPAPASGTGAATGWFAPPLSGWRRIVMTSVVVMLITSIAVSLLAAGALEPADVRGSPLSEVPWLLLMWGGPSVTTLLHAAERAALAAGDVPAIA